MSLNLAVMLRESALAKPQKPAVILDDFKIPYAAVEAASNQVAANLRAAGLQSGERVGLMLPNVPQFVIAYFGILKAGLVVVPMNVLLRAPEVAFYLGDSEAKVLITWEDFAEEAMKGAAELRGLTAYVVNRPGSDSRPPNTRSFNELMSGSPDFDMVASDPDDTAVILYTSGTTGKPKGAELSHFNLFMCCQVGADRLVEFQENDVAMAVLPLFHSFGQSNVMNTSIYSGGTITLVPRFDADKVLEVMQRDRVTIFCGVPTMYFALLNHPRAGDYDLSSLRLCISGGAAMPGEVMTAFEKRFGVTMLEGYGLSETSPSASFNVADSRKFLSVGRPIWGVEMRIHDEQDNPLSAGRENVGEIVIRGWNVMKGYFKQPEATAEALKGGWFHSGDMGYMDEDGFFFIVDRKKELIIRGGFNVYPREVEEVLYAHPAVAEAAVIGVPDERLGEEVKAVVALRPGQAASQEDLIAYCKERVAAYKYPRTVQFVETLPKGPTGKILKRQLKAQLEAAAT
jgi:long-chain acyl-CoA synthetase